MPLIVRRRPVPGLRRCARIAPPAPVPQPERQAGQQRPQRRLILVQAVERNARQGVKMVGMFRDKVARPGRDRACEARLPHQREFPRPSRAGIADRIGEMSDRQAELGFEPRLALDDLSPCRLDIVLRQHRMRQRMGADADARRARKRAQGFPGQAVALDQRDGIDARLSRQIRNR